MAAPGKAFTSDRIPRRWDRAFYLAAAFAAAAITFAGFERTWFLRSQHGLGRLPLLIQLHGILFTAWLLLFFLQPLLVTIKRTDLHRKLGIVGGVVAAGMTVIVPLTAIAVTRPGYRPGPPTPLSFLTVPFFDIGAFAILVAGAFWYRKKTDTHKRLMLLATFCILPAAVSRIPLHFIANNGALAFYGLTDLLLVPCLIYDAVAHHRVHRAYVFGGLLLVLHQPLSIYVGHTAWWTAFAQWITR